jgi:hypothetical protein
MLWSQQPNGKPLKQDLVSCCMDMHFPLESCNWVENVYIINVKNFENISYVMKFLENFWKNMPPWKKMVDVTIWLFTIWFIAITTFAFDQCLIGRIVRWLSIKLIETNVMKNWCWGRMCNHNSLIMESCTY